MVPYVVRYNPMTYLFPKWDADRRTKDMCSSNPLGMATEGLSDLGLLLV